MAYNPNAYYTFRDSEGNELFTSYGDNDYVRQSIEQGIPISINAKGEWFTNPYLEVTPTGYVSYIPNWFRGTDEYNQWKSIESQAASFSVNEDNFNNLNNTLKSLGNQGALRYTTYKQTDEVGITDPSLKQFVFDQYLSALNEGANKEAASIQAYGSTDSGQSVAEFAREFKNMSKEDLSKNLVKWEYIINDKNADPVDRANVYTAYKILSLVADNPTDYGDGKEFEGLLEASEWQKFQTHIANVTQTIAEGFPILNLSFRAESGIVNAIGGRSFADGWQLEKNRNQQWNYLRNEATGAGLRGTEGSAVSGSVAGTVLNMAGTMVQSMAFGTYLNSTSLGSSVGSVLNGGSSALGTIGGGMVYEFFANDLPVDLSIFATDLASTGSAEKAWEDTSGGEESTQPLFGLFGPQVPAGLKYNLIGDAVLDLSLPMISIGSKAVYGRLDDITGGSVSKIRENVAVKNLAIQQTISDLPVIGTGLQKFSNWLFSAENASFIREKRKEAIIAGSMTPYTDAQNLLTLKNHYGAEVVAPLYKKYADDLNINTRVKEFQKNANKYGGMGDTKVEWESAKGGVAKKIAETVQDDLPRDVKTGLLDFQRLEELKGERELEGAGLISNPKRDTEIATLEKKVADMPEEIRKFAEDFSTLNKRVEQMAVDLGLESQDWLDALLQDPRWKNYMVRQVLLPGGIQKAGSYDPAMNKILSGKRTGYYNPDQTLSPLMTLDMKVHALGNAYAWNERAKALVASEITQGKITSGGDSVELAQKISAKKAELMAVDATNTKLGYDTIVNGINDRNSNLSESIRKINEKLQSVDNITAKSVYTTDNNLETKGVVADYNSGKITYGEGVLEGAGLAPQDGNTVVNNTYITGNKGYAGIASNGVPYEYTIENNKITSMNKITSPEGLADSVTGANQYWKIDVGYTRIIGEENVAALNRAAMFYRDNFPTIQLENNIVATRLRKGRWGEVDGSPEIVKNPDGTLNMKFESKVNTLYYSKGNEKKFMRDLAESTEERARRLSGRGNVTGRWHPQNSNDLANTFIHESGHSLVSMLTQSDVNVRIKAGETNLVNSRWDFYYKTGEMEKNILDAAARNIGERLTDELRTTISVYAAYPRELSKRNAETIAEALTDYAFNGANAAPFSQAIAQEMSTRLQKHSMVVNPKESLRANNLEIPKGLFRGDDYAFPTSIKTQAQKAEWLDKWRQKNPYLKGEMTEETFQKANLWDSYFQKEIRSYDANNETVAPDSLIKKSGDFVEKQRAQMAKDITNEIKKMSGGELDSDLAMIVMGKNGDDIAKAMDNYIIRQIDTNAEAIAKNMDGGLTTDNLNTAKITLWSDESIKESTKDMLLALVPDGGDSVASKIDILFDNQAKGLAAYDKLPLDSKQLLAEKEELVNKLYAENKKTLKAGKELDKNSSFIDGGSHVIHYKEAGEDVYVTVNDPVVASMLQKPYDYKEHGMIAESMQTMASFLATTYRLGTTGINPMSFIRNVLRDPIQAMTTAGFNPLNMTLSPEVFYKTLRQYGLDDATIESVTNMIREWSKTSTLTEEMRLGPGRNAASYRNEIQKIDNKLRDVTNGKLIRTFQTPLESWEGFFRNQIGQQSFVKNFKRTGDVNKALSSALFDSSNATTNFSHAIGKFKNVTATIPYLSSAVNGTVSFWRLFNVDPLGMTTRITAGFMLPVMAITAWNLSSEENRRAYETLPEWFKQGHIVLTDPSGNIIAFPLPEEIQQFAGTARKLIEYTNEVSPYSLATIAAQGAFGFLPFEVDGFWGDDGSLQLKEGAFQMVSGLIPQAATTLYELIWKQDLFTGQDLSTYNGINTTINTLGNLFGTGIIQAFNSIGIMAGVPESDLIGKSLQNTIARDLFGQGFDAAKNQFMEIVGKPAQLQQDGKMSKATGLFRDNEELKKKIDALNTKIAVSSDSEKDTLEEQKQTLINEFTNKVKNAMDKYQRMFTLTGGLEQWQKNRLVQLLTLGDAWSSGNYTSYQAESASEAYLNERGLAMQRYVQAGLPAGPDLENLAGTNSIEIQAALNRLYGAPKQAATDYRNAVESSGIKKVRNQFYDAISQIYDAAEAQNKKPDYDLIEKIQARYLQMVDSVLVPVINQYGINILNNSDFIDAVRKQVNGMIPSDDWKQSTKNAKKYLSAKEFPTAGVDVKKWLIQRYSSGLRDRGIGSDQEVVDRLVEIKEDLDAGRRGSAQSKINSLKNGINKANYYISATDLQTLTQYNNMLK